jgi:hypothetical protein
VTAESRLRPFLNWFVMDPAGRIIADPYPNPPRPVVGQDYGFRDYAARLLGPDAPADRDAVHLSQVFLSDQDGRCKFAAVSRAWEGGRLLGLVAAAVAIDSKLVGLDMRDEAPGDGVLGPMDRHPRRPGEEDDFTRLPQYVFVLHRDYDGSGLAPIGADDRGPLLRGFDAEPSRRHRTDSFFRGGRLWLADYARAGETHFVVVAERPYPWEVHLALWVALAACGGGLALLLRRTYRGRSS